MYVCDDKHEEKRSTDVSTFLYPIAGGNSATGAIAGGVAAGAALLFAAPAIAFAWWRRRKPQEYFFDVPGEKS